jgi:hypothetical protein
MGGKSEALAIPKLRGMANKNTTNPAVASAAKFSFNPAQSSLGTCVFVVVFILFKDKRPRLKSLIS